MKPSDSEGLGRESQALSLFRGDPFRRVLHALRVEDQDSPRPLRRILLLVGITWPVLAILAALGGVAVGLTPRESFLRDIAAISQFLVVMPLLLVAEGYIDGWLREVGHYLEESGVISHEELPAFRRLLIGLARARRSLLPELICLSAAYASVWLWLRDELHNGVSTWHAPLTAAGEHLSMAGWWEGLGAVPLFNFLVFRWVWKVLLWCVFLGRLSRFRLRVAPAHPDLAGGLACFGQLQSRFGILIFAVGAMIAALMHHKIVIEGASPTTFATWAPSVAFVLLAPLAFAAPLLFFTRAMWEAKRAALRDYSIRLAWLCRGLQEKWQASVPTPEGRLEIAGDLGSVADASAAFQVVKSMHVVPFDFGSLLRLSASAIMPMMPVMLRFLPLPAPVREFLALFA